MMVGLHFDKTQAFLNQSDDTRDWTFKLLTFIHFKFYVENVSPF